MPAQSKDELQKICGKEFSKLATLIQGIAELTAMSKDQDDTSIKDVVAHRAHWIDLFFGWHADGLAGKEVCFPARGYKWSELKRYNADLRAHQMNLGWSEAVTMLHDRHEALVRFIETCDDADLYGAPMKGAKNNWTTGRWVEATGPSHYRSAAKYVRSRLRAEA